MANPSGSKPLDPGLHTVPMFQWSNMLISLKIVFISPVKIAINLDIPLFGEKREHNVVPAVISWFEKPQIHIP